MSRSRFGRAGSALKVLTGAVLGAGVLVALPDTVEAAAPTQLNAGAIGFIPPSAEITPAAGAANFGAGSAVAISGSVAVVGSPGGNFVDVFNKTSKGWIDVTPAGLTGMDTSAGDQFGASVAISSTEIAIGAPMNAGQGAVYVFTKGTKGWVQTAEFVGSDTATGDLFGQSVAIAGTEVVVGAPMNAAGQGATYVFTKGTQGWAQTAEFIGNDTTTGDLFGESVALSGSTVLVGAPQHQVGNNAKQGAAYIFAKSTKGWAQTAELSAPDGAAVDRFGHAVALVGTLAVIGAPNHTVGSSTGQGAAYVVLKGTKGWGVIGELTSPDGSATNRFGDSVALSTSAVLVGAPKRSVGGNLLQGAAYVFTKSGANFNVSGEFIAPDGAAGDQAGTAVAASGTVGLVGAPGHAVNGNTAQGVAYVIPV
jgi:hypothetical protein